MKLLTSNAKLEKCAKFGALSVGLQLMPATRLRDVAIMGFTNICPDSTPGCRAACLASAGRGSFPVVRSARKARTRLFKSDRRRFLDQLHLELSAHERRSARQGLRPAVRLNVLSDIPWEEIDPTLFSHHPELVFYDYSKSYDRALDFCLSGDHPRNYHLTFSWSGQNLAQCLTVLSAGGNVAIPVSDRIKTHCLSDGQFPPFEETEQSVRFELSGINHGDLTFVDGDVHDLTYQHPPGSILLLSQKGKAKRDRSGFVIR